MTESPRERFLRNHQENIGVMRAAALRADKEGRILDAARIWEIVAAWESIAATAKEDKP